MSDPHNIGKNNHLKIIDFISNQCLLTLEFNLRWTSIGSQYKESVSTKTTKCGYTLQSKEEA